jgi:hypothetical protein
VVATGNTRVPHQPSFPGLESFGGPVMHSSAYRNGRAYAGRRVLVIGIGNSGAEIALDLVEHGARPGIAVRSPVNIVPRDFLGIPILAWGIALDRLPVRVADGIAWLVSRLVLGRLERLGLRRLPYGPNAQIRRYGRVPLLDVGTVARIRRNEIEILPHVESFSPGRARFSDGAERPFDAVVLATGYRPALDAFLEEGASDVPPGSGREVLPGLYLCGFHVAATGMLREIGREARRIARFIRNGNGRRQGRRKEG